MSPFLRSARKIGFSFQLLYAGTDLVGFQFGVGRSVFGWEPSGTFNAAEGGTTAVTLGEVWTAAQNYFQDAGAYLYRAAGGR